MDDVDLFSQNENERENTNTTVSVFREDIWMSFRFDTLFPLVDSTRSRLLILIGLYRSLFFFLFCLVLPFCDFFYLKILNNFLYLLAMKIKESEKLVKYLDLTCVQKFLWIMKLTGMPILAVVFETVPNKMLTILEQQKIRVRIEIVQTKAQLR